MARILQFPQGRTAPKWGVSIYDSDGYRLAQAVVSEGYKRLIDAIAREVYPGMMKALEVERSDGVR